VLYQDSSIAIQAERIADPVARLRFLRGAMSYQSRKSSTRRAVAHTGWVILAAAIAMAPGPRPKGSAKPLPIAPSIVAASEASPKFELKPERVWLVERSGATELYSNGLRIDRSMQISNRPRANYPIFNADSRIIGTRSAPAGIVYHTTESLIAPFEEDQNRRLRELGRNLLDVVRGERAYHYLIDRFGRVFAAVAESDAANHAGNSVWGGPEGIYVNLNDSFLAVAFEAQTGATEQVTPAQIASAKSLTEVLRSRYGIPAENCVTHAQVSVNPLNMKIGEHTDWASDFPFAAVGLPDNYSQPLASITAFGFEYDPVFVRVTGGTWKGIEIAQARLAKQAAANRVPLVQYRALLKHRYQEIASALKHADAGEIPK
jgi:hypothetical protein